MISAFKNRLRLSNNGQSSNDKIDDKKRLSSGNYQPMDQSLQKKFSKGVQYNMKIIIRGDKNVGKSCLFSRLQGLEFKEEYIPTEEIQVANIEWNYNVTDDKIKVELWEICDKGKKRKPHNELKLNEKKNNSKTIQPPIEEQPVLDAEFLDVYKNTNGVILVFDITKTWSFEYVEREIENIPKNIPVLICGNHKDQGHHGTPINEDKVKSFIETIERESSGQIRYVETSMRNGFGLKYIYKFFNLPFLHLKKVSLLKQIEVNDREIDGCCQELHLLEESDDQNYERFMYTIQNRRREIADKLSQIPKSTKSMDSNLTSKSVPFNLAGTSNNGLNAKDIIKPTPSIVIGANNPLPIPKNYNNNKSSPTNGISNNNIGNNKLNENKNLVIENETEDQFKLRQFLEDAIEVRDELNKQQQQQQIVKQEEESDDEELDKPKILSYQDELDEEDRIEGQPSSILEISLENNELKELDNSQLNNNKEEMKEDSQLNNGHRRSIKKSSKLAINLIDNLPDNLILNDKQPSTTKTKKKKSKKSSSSSSNNDKISKKKEKKLEDLLGPLVTPLDDGPNSNDDYLAL